ncbi:hypothetical protein CHS0354_035251 [Potamilus streckersoni]|uniref:HIT domain-containing protein n=1 Tax=Potamilus streckersoni TaxID=2493646 RepID=A0AAE0S3B2_9BIVA|nr:hypothetical protein CHS0354_035251 [Potamilus streckersoni]
MTIHDNSQPPKASEDWIAPFEKDTRYVFSWPLCDVRLCDNSRYPWILLIPRIAGLREIYRLNPADSTQFWQELQSASKGMAEIFRPDKLNTAWIGNITPQFHAHIIARRQNDIAFPATVWGRSDNIPYDAEELENRASYPFSVLRSGQQDILSVSVQFRNAADSAAVRLILQYSCQIFTARAVKCRFLNL